MMLHTVIVSYNRPELLQRTLESYLATVTVPYSLVIVDNGSAKPTRDFLRRTGFIVLEQDKNTYPGPATNLGFAEAGEATHLHRSDNDMEYLPGWCEEVEERFIDNPAVGQVGLRTDEEENHNLLNVGGTAIFRRELWDAGLRYREESWRELGTMTEDYWISLAVVEMGWRWTRVTRPCVIHTASGDRGDPYYRRSYGIRGIA